MVTLPENKKRDIGNPNKMKIWLYGAPMCGKTYLASQFPNPLILSTDGNIEFCDAPYILIRDEVTKEGRMTKTIPAWQMFKDAVDELAKKDNTYETIVVDLVEDLYESCRLYKYAELGITHESDDSFRAWDKVRTEYMSTMRKVSNLDYNIVFISHEDLTRDIVSSSGKVTAISPNIQPKIANKLSGLMDLVARCTYERGKREIHIKSDAITFGGVRIPGKIPDTIPMEYSAIQTLYMNNKKE